MAGTSNRLLARLARKVCVSLPDTRGFPPEKCVLTGNPVRAAIADGAKPSDLNRPGHVFPLRAQPGGVLTRGGHTEATIDLVTLAGFKPAGVLCELTNDDGTMARAPECSSTIWR